MKQWLFKGIILFLIPYTVLSQKVILKGNIPSYAGESIEFRRISNPVTRDDTILARSKVNNNGDFSLDFNISKIRHIYCNVGVYKCFLYVVPDAVYTITLPEKKEPTLKEKLNPYFELIETQVGIISKKDIPTNTPTPEKKELNYLIYQFNEDFLVHKQFFVNRILSNIKRSELDSVTQLLDSRYQYPKNDFFKTYKHYKYANLDYLISKKDIFYIINKYFKGKPPLFNNPAYLYLYDLVFNKIFYNISQTDEGQKLDSAISQCNYSEFINSIDFKNNELNQSVILKGIYDGFYNGYYKSNHLIDLLNIYIKKTPSEKYNNWAEQVRYKINSLRKNHAPANFTLPDSDSNMVSLNELKGKFVYLNFFTANNYVCQKHVRMLKKYHTKFGENLNIVTIFVAKDFTDMVNFKNVHNCNWKFLYYDGKGDLLDHYQVEVFPTYFLLDKQNKIVYLPTPSPEEDFEIKLHKTFRDRGILYPKDEKKKELFR